MSPTADGAARMLDLRVEVPSQTSSKLRRDPRKRVETLRMRTALLPGRPAVGLFRSRRLLALARDDTLALQLQRGNEAAFEAVFERYGAGVLGFCRHMLGSAEEAEDAVQQTFASAFRDLQRGGERELALKPWLYAIARNRCLSMLRSRREHLAIEVDLPTRGLAEQVEQRADLRHLLQDLRQLAPEQRAALLLTELGALSHAEVGQVLGVETVKVKALVFRARTGLIQRRDARETPCTEIRQQLANLRGGALRRSALRHHLHQCPGCRAYRRHVAEQRKMLAAALPVAPSLGLKSGVLAALGLGGGSSGSGLAAGLGGVATAFSSSLGTGTAAKLAAVGLLAGGGAVAGTTIGDDPAAVRPSPVETSPSAPAREPQAAAPRTHAVGSPQVRRRAAAPGGRPDPGHARRPDAGERRSPTLTRARTQRMQAQAPAKNAVPRTQGAGRKPHTAQASPGARPEPSGRGPVESPPAAVPVERGPPEPKPKPSNPVQVTPPAPVPAIAPGPQKAASPAQPPRPASPAQPPKPVKSPKG
jgi:RNA polymerase sigma factor (sigma-70 family)